MNWKKSDIRKARKVELAPVLRKRGVALVPRNKANFVVAEHDDLVVKKSYWRWPSRNLAGNSIDYFITVERKSFQESMSILAEYCTDAKEYTSALKLDRHGLEG